MLTELLIGYTPARAAQRVAAARRMIRQRIIWLGIAVVMCVVIVAWQWTVMSTGQKVTVFVAGIGYSLIWLAIAFVGWAKARTVLDGIGQGVAVSIGQRGIFIVGTPVEWADVAKVAAGRPGRFRAEALSVTTATGGTLSVPLESLDTMPGTIDSAVRAFSGGVHSLDLGSLGN